MAARKVALSSGDIRRALRICSLAAELVRKKALESDPPAVLVQPKDGGMPYYEQEGKPVKVTIADIQQAAKLTNEKPVIEVLLNLAIQVAFCCTSCFCIGNCCCRSLGTMHVACSFPACPSRWQTRSQSPQGKCATTVMLQCSSVLMLPCRRHLNVLPRCVHKCLAIDPHCKRYQR